jgi:hypothetical protein
LNIQNASVTPVTPFANDMRMYLGGYGYGTIADFEMAACGAAGLTSNSSADGRGNDVEANTAVSTLAADGDLCRMKM